MAKLKTLLLTLAGFILVGCGDPRAEDKKTVVNMLIVNQDLTKDQAECAVNALSGEMDDKHGKPYFYGLELMKNRKLLQIVYLKKR